MDLLEKVWNKMKCRIKSPLLWISLLLFLAKQFEISEITELGNDDIEYIINLLIGILVSLGILSNPEKNCFNKTNSIDDY